MHLFLSIGLLALSITLFSVPLFSYQTPMILFPIAGTVGTAVWFIFGIYDSMAQNHALKYATGVPKQGYKAELRRLRQDRAKVARELYANKGYSSSRSGPQKQLKELDEQIAIHTGVQDEVKPEPVRSKW